MNFSRLVSWWVVGWCIFLVYDKIRRFYRSEDLTLPLDPSPSDIFKVILRLVQSLLVLLIQPISYLPFLSSGETSRQDILFCLKRKRRDFRPSFRLPTFTVTPSKPELGNIIYPRVSKTETTS